MAILIGRRTFLSSAGIAAAAHLVPELRRPAHAAGPEPRRLVNFFTHQGTHKSQWTPTGTETNFTLGPILKGLEPYKDQLILLDSLEMKSTKLNDIQDPNVGHPLGQVHALTGWPSTKPLYPGSLSIASGPSFDQVIMEDFKARNALPTPVDFISLFMSSQLTSSAPAQMLTYSQFKVVKTASGTTNQYVPCIKNSKGAFDKLFGGMVTSPSPMTDDLMAKKRKSILDFAIKEYGTVAAEVENKRGRALRMKLDQHAESLREIEKGIPVGGGGGPVTPNDSGACLAANGGAPTFDSTKPLWEDLGNTMPKLALLALACDRTRIVHLQVEDAFVAGVHDMVHMGQYDRAQGYFDTLSAKFTALVKSLADAKTSDGKSLLYHSVVAWTGELAYGQDHSTTDLKWLTVGSAGGGLKPGKWLKLGNRSHVDMFATIAKALGSQATSFGHPSLGSKPIDSILA